METAVRPSENVTVLSMRIIGTDGHKKDTGLHDYGVGSVKGKKSMEKIGRLHRKHLLNPNGVKFLLRLQKKIAQASGCSCT